MSKALTLASLGKNLLKTSLNKQAIFSVGGINLEQKRYRNFNAIYTNNLLI